MTVSPCGPVIKTVCFQCRGPWLVPYQGTEIPQAAERKKTNKPQEKQMSKDKKERSKDQNIGALFPSCKVQLLGMSPIILIPQLAVPLPLLPPPLGHFLPCRDYASKSDGSLDPSKLLIYLPHFLILEDHTSL